MIRAHLCALGLCLQTQERGPEAKSPTTRPSEFGSGETKSTGGNSGLSSLESGLLGVPSPSDLSQLPQSRGLCRDKIPEPNWSGRTSVVLGLGFGAYIRAHGPVLFHWLPSGAGALAPGVGSAPQLTICPCGDPASQTSGALVGQTNTDASLSHPPRLSFSELIYDLRAQAPTPKDRYQNDLNLQLTQQNTQWMMYSDTLSGSFAEPHPSAWHCPLHRWGLKMNE